MHKLPSKQRYITASNLCTTKTLSSDITYCLKKVQQTLTHYCDSLSNNPNDVNRMWIIDNSIHVKKFIKRSNRNKVRNVRTYDFSTLYTSLPHAKLKERIAKVISMAFDDDQRKYITPSASGARWNKGPGKFKQTKLG